MFDDIRVLGNKMKDVFTMLRRTVSVATVSQVDSELRRVKVTFAGGRIPESDWLSVVGSRTKGVNASWNMAVGEQVLCLFPPIGSMVRGYVLGSLVNVNARPYTTNPDKFGIQFEDGTLLEYDQVTQTGVLKIQGGTPSIQVGPDKVSIVSDVDIEGAVVISKTLDVGGNTSIGGNLSVTGTVSGQQTATFMGTVGAAGYGGPVSGGAAKMQNGMEVSGTATINGVTVSVDTHAHVDAEGRPTGSAVSVRSASLLSRLLGYLRR
ncbi:phage baseplate assembly protein V [Vibrio parahaemolyticus]|uniref:phage baseplate assembly protein V n=2 Tax=Vibrio parahaemolyticus TaxID=670 RepID=UPI001121BC66|nr:phage baseplate assembly protein V [Vibrio parahaemolyticus]MDF4503346.1 phage baseplate assembly protein V [Vibrio parahaemolyticus]MDG2809545.1 phage baseplate assembly protein V [Vibrio parahaemolyticus]MDG3428171.1 phage baseplate assembly protein V [Vibrio parahaemolyticus]TOR06451.1 baseplate protein [Vibrio parahaemolyticus]UJW91731.1 phage baseplate assembly protein V [Vibrio parahaemolyticus]